MGLFSKKNTDPHNLTALGDEITDMMALLLHNVSERKKIIHQLQQDHEKFDRFDHDSLDAYDSSSLAKLKKLAQFEQQEDKKLRVLWKKLLKMDATVTELYESGKKSGSIPKSKLLFSLQNLRYINRMIRIITNYFARAEIRREKEIDFVNNRSAATFHKLQKNWKEEEKMSHEIVTLGSDMETFVNKYDSYYNTDYKKGMAVLVASPALLALSEQTEYPGVSTVASVLLTVAVLYSVVRMIRHMP